MSLRQASVHGHERIFAAGMAWLLLLLALSVLANTRSDTDQVAVQLQAATAVGASTTTTLSNDGQALLLAGGKDDEVVAQLRFQLPQPDAERSRWVVWLGRDPAQVWLQAPGWSSLHHDFFRPEVDEGVLPSGFILPLPADWQGDTVLTLHARGDMPSALRPRIMREGSAMRLARRAIAFDSAIYACLFMLALLALSLYSAARERAFLALFGCASAALVYLAAENGHLYAMPGLGLLAGWHGAGIWALGTLLCAGIVQVLLRYADLRDGVTPLAHVFRGYCGVLVVVVALCLLDLPVLRPSLPMLVSLAWAGAAIAALVILTDAMRRHVPMAWSLLLLAAITVGAMLVRAALMRGYLADGLWIRRAYELGIVATATIITIALITRISEYREQGDQDRLARADTERRMGREAARTGLTTALQTRLRDLDANDIAWTAFHLLLEHLLPQVPAALSAVIARGYHGQDLLLVEPAEHKQALHDDILARSLVLKRFAATTVPLQQAIAGTEQPGIEALLPLSLQGAGWGLLLLQRAGNEGFSTEELALAAEFSRLTTLHADETLAAIKLRRSAELDALTGTFNRRSIDQWLSRSFADAHRRERPLSLLFIDIDHFKVVNDRLGHAAGDHCLRQVAMTLRQALDADDMLGRYGGEEFVALLPERGGADARAIGERLRTAVERSEIDWEGTPVPVTVSIGVATRLERESTPAAAVERADKALYAAKRGGRNCVHVAPAVFT